MASTLVICACETIMNQTGVKPVSIRIRDVFLHLTLGGAGMLNTSPITIVGAILKTLTRPM